MNTAESTSQNDADVGEYSRDAFARRNPLEIGVQLRNLANRGDFLTVEFQGGQFVTRILDVDTRARRIVFDWGASQLQNDMLLASKSCQLRASPEGVRVEFELKTPVVVGKHGGLPAFESGFPEVLFFIQRREYFRVDTPVTNPCWCRGEWVDETPFEYEVHDISLGGIGLRTTDERVETLLPGTRFSGVELDLRQQGKLKLELTFVGLRYIDLPNGKRRYHLGMSFDALPGTTENTLQRYITQLEMKRRSLAR